MTTRVNKSLDDRALKHAAEGKGLLAFAWALFLLAEDIADSLRRIADRMDKR
jgi:hypothetical protein